MNVSNRSVFAWVVAFAAMGAAPAWGQVPYKIVTASERGTYIQIGRDLSKIVAPPAGIDLEVLASAGSAENVKRLRHEPGVKFALVQSDVYQAYIDQDRAGNADAGVLIRPLRVILPLYNEEVYFITRADSPLEFVHQIKGSKINVGALGSGTAMTSTTLYRQMFDAPIAEASASFLSNEDALVKLTGDKSVDVVVVVAGQPARLLVDMTPAARQLIKLLKFDASRPESVAALKTYFPATVRATSYPNLLPENIPAVAVKAYLVTYDYSLGGTVSALQKFTRSLCQNFSVLQSTGHPKWREVELAQPPLGRGWTYYPPVAREMRNCAARLAAGAPAAASAPTPALAKTCNQQEKILGLCK